MSIPWVCRHGEYKLIDTLYVHILLRLPLAPTLLGFRGFDFRVCKGILHTIYTSS